MKTGTKLNKKIFSEMKELAENMDRISDWIYQRQEFDHSVLVRIFNQLLGVMGDVSENMGNIPETKDYLNIFRDRFTELTSAFESGDLILVADIMHHEFVEGILKWD